MSDIKTYRKQYWENNKEILKAKHRERYYKDLDLTHKKHREYNKKYYRKNKDKIKEKQRRAYYENVGKSRQRVHQYYVRTMVQQSIKKAKYGSDIAQTQNGLTFISRSEKARKSSPLIAALPKPIDSNDTSRYKGVCQEKSGKWRAYLNVNGKKYRKTFKTEDEAIKYRLYLEDKYFTAEQKRIKEKYRKD